MDNTNRWIIICVMIICLVMGFNALYACSLLEKRVDELEKRLIVVETKWSMHGFK